MGGKNSYESIKRYQDKVYDKILVRLPKGQKDTIQAHAQALGESVNGFIGRAIAETIEHDTDPPEVKFHEAVQVVASQFGVTEWEVLDGVGRVKADKETAEFEMMSPMELYQIAQEVAALQEGDEMLRTGKGQHFKGTAKEFFAMLDAEDDKAAPTADEE